MGLVVPADRVTLIIAGSVHAFLYVLPPAVYLSLSTSAGSNTIPGRCLFILAFLTTHDYTILNQITRRLHGRLDLSSRPGSSITAQHSEPHRSPLHDEGSSSSISPSPPCPPTRAASPCPRPCCQRQRCGLAPAPTEFPSSSLHREHSTGLPTSGLLATWPTRRWRRRDQVMQLLGYSSSAHAVVGVVATNITGLLCTITSKVKPVELMTTAMHKDWPSPQKFIGHDDQQGEQGGAHHHRPAQGNVKPAKSQ
ncbi:uncharacterized protein [Triticum aestivum]|uniref:uncharacterized protein n=1 Tax=Triticum aestivum TaxID=4565 RepID=UPI001D0171A9|nr:uncharacterized protein LOC123152891 [Triticum aestivum]